VSTTTREEVAAARPLSQATWAGAGAPEEAAPVPPEGERLSFGMDDPALAGRLDRTGLDAAPGSDRKAITYQVDAAEAGEVTAERSGEGARERVTTAATDRTTEAETEHGESVAEEPVEETERRRVGTAGGLLRLLVWSGLGASAGWVFAYGRTQDPTPWVLGGTAAGLVIGWIMVRWSYRKR
jgi:hypothetical protein